MGYSAERYALTAARNTDIYRLRAELRADLLKMRTEMRAETRSAIDAALEAQAREARSKALVEKSEREFKGALLLMSFGNVLFAVWALLLYRTDIFGGMTGRSVT